MKNGLIKAAGLALAAGITCTPALAGGTSMTSPVLSARANQQMNLLNSAVEVIDVPRAVGRGFGLDVTIGGVGYSLDLVPYRVRSTDYSLLVWDGAGYTEMTPGAQTTVRGAVVGDPGSVVSGGLVAGGIALQVVFADGEQFTIEPLDGAGDGTHVIYKDTDVIIDPTVGCGMPDGDPNLQQGNAGGVASGGLQCAELGIDCDFQWFQIFGSVAACEAEANAIVAQVSVQWETEVGIQFQVTGIVVRTSQLYTTNDPTDLLCQFSNEWFANDPVPNRDLAHLFTGRELNGSTIGLASNFGQICNEVACGTFPCNCGPFGPNGHYCLSQTEFNSDFACSTDLVSHEMGHLFNAVHCSCPSNTMNPFITCANTFSAATIGTITSYAAGLPCLDADCAGGACPGDGNCFESNGTPGCEIAECCEIVCAQDAFCCDNTWDGICASAAQDLCGNAACPGAGSCCESNGSPGCDTVECCKTVCFNDPFCCDNTWDGICANAALAICEVCAGACPGQGSCCESNGTPGCNDQACCEAVCAQDAFCCDTSWDTACANQAEDLCAFCSACPGEGNCCESNGSPGCDDAGCCQAVCAVDPFCCENTWDGLCASQADDLCAGCFGACPGEGDCCEANGSVGCDDAACCKAVCASDPFCCNNSWDGLCASAASELCGNLCGNPACPGEGSCFFSNGTPGCDDEACCELICSQDAFCCDNTWDGICAGAANEQCGNPVCPGEGDCNVSNGSPGCNDQACCNAVCAQDAFCCNNTWDGICANAAIEICNLGPPTGACCLPDGSCVETSAADCAGDYQGDGTLCADVNCSTGCPGEGNCFFPNGTPGCDDEACCEAVCAQDPFCCNNQWDGLCAGAAQDLCGNAACPGDGDCFTPGGNGSPGCDDQACCNAVCAIDPFCCNSTWDGLCANEAADICPNAPGTGACCLPDGSCIETTEAACQGDYQGDGTTCADVNCPPPPFECPGEGNCCEPNGSPGCNDLECCETVCAADPFCCENTWDGICANAALEACAVCQSDCPGDGCCYTSNGSPGCDDTACCEAVCAQDAFCCDNTWDGLCASAAVELCFDPACPGDTNGDFNVDVQDLTNVILDWGSTAFCGSGSDVAPNGIVDVGDLTAVILNWGSCLECGSPGAGPCGEPNGTPYCNDAACCKAVCAIDPFCCDIEWDGLCANEALEICQGGPSDEGEPCGEDVNGGCNSTPTAFGSISCGETVVGNAWADGGTRDTDWYLVTTTDACTTLTATLNADFPAVLFIVDGIDACAPVVVGEAGDGAGTPAFADVGPGNYVVFVAAADFDGTPCGTTNGYEVSLECAPCAPGASGAHKRPTATLGVTE